MAHYRKITVKDKVYQYVNMSRGGFFVRGVGSCTLEDMGYTFSEINDSDIKTPWGPKEVAEYIEGQTSG